MALPLLGKEGAIRIATELLAHISDWELAINQDVLEKTSFGDGFQRTYIAGLRGPVATFNGFYDETDTAQFMLADLIHSTSTPTTLTVVLQTNSTWSTASKQGWTGKAIPNITIGAAVDGVQTFSGTLTFSGGLDTYA